MRGSACWRYDGKYGEHGGDEVEESSQQAEAGRCAVCLLHVCCLSCWELQDDSNIQTAAAPGRLQGEDGRLVAQGHNIGVL